MAGEKPEDDYCDLLQVLELTTDQSRTQKIAAECDLIKQRHGRILRGKFLGDFCDMLALKSSDRQFVLRRLAAAIRSGERTCAVR
jgi:hypothetical protein